MENAILWQIIWTKYLHKRCYQDNYTVGEHSISDTINVSFLQFTRPVRVEHFKVVSAFFAGSSKFEMLVMLLGTNMSFNN